VTGRERRCRWLLLAYPAWYRRRRGEEMLGTLLEATPAGASWPSFRDARALITGGSRARGWIWLLSMLWVAAGVVNTGYFFYVSTEPWAGDGRGFGLDGWYGGNSAALQILIDLNNSLFAVPLILVVAGFIWLRGWRRHRRLRAVAWAGAWIAGVALLDLANAWGQYPLHNCPNWQAAPQCPVGSGPAVVSWGELAICAAWLVVGGLMAWILAVPARHPDVLEKSIAGLGD
jgi:hypothetical protein